MRNNHFLFRMINIAIVVVALLYYNQILSLNLELSKANATIETMAAAGQQQEGGETKGKFQDGSYQGSGTGFGGTVTVEVTVHKGLIYDIAIISAENEDAAYYNMALPILDSMIDSQSSDVDVVSGATYTSNGIKDAVKAALTKAVRK